MDLKQDMRIYTLGKKGFPCKYEEGRCWSFYGIFDLYIQSKIDVGAGNRRRYA